METSKFRSFIAQALALSLALASVLIVFPSDADAGVLFRNRRNVIRTSLPRFRQQQYKVRRSTAVMRSVGLKLKSKEYAGVSQTLKLIKAQEKYEVKLFKWEKKRDKQLAKIAKKKKKLAEKKAKKLERQRARIAKKQKKDQENIQLAQDTSTTGSGKVAQKQSSRGSLGIGSLLSTGEGKQGFWAKLARSLFGGH